MKTQLERFTELLEEFELETLMTRSTYPSGEIKISIFNINKEFVDVIFDADGNFKEMF